MNSQSGGRPRLEKQVAGRLISSRERTRRERMAAAHRIASAQWEIKDERGGFSSLSLFGIDAVFAYRPLRADV